MTGSQKQERGSFKLRKIVTGTFLSTIAIITGLGILEIVLRLLVTKGEIFYLPTGDKVLHHRLKPNTVSRFATESFDTEYRISSLGLRDKEYSVQKPANTFRILMLGDSYTEGYGVHEHETFSTRLEEMLQHRQGASKFEVINCGVRGYSPLLEYLFLKNYGLQVNPDLVILFTDLNDESDDIKYTALARFDEKGIPVAVSHEPEQLVLNGPMAAIKDWLKNNTWLYNFVYSRISQQIHVVRRERNFAAGDIHRDDYAMLRETYVDSDSNWKLTHKYLLLTRDLLKEKGIDFWISVYPYGLQIHPNEWNAGRILRRFKQDTVYSTRPQELVEQWARANDITTINLCPDFKERSKTLFPLYWDIDGHWRAAGHQIVADALYKRLQPYLREKEQDHRMPPSHHPPALNEHGQFLPKR
jgi:lysophospholipase L1-like esterase